MWSIPSKRATLIQELEYLYRYNYEQKSKILCIYFMADVVDPTSCYDCLLPTRNLGP